MFDNERRAWQAAGWPYITAAASRVDALWAYDRQTRCPAFPGRFLAAGAGSSAHPIDRISEEPFMKHPFSTAWLAVGAALFLSACGKGGEAPVQDTPSVPTQTPHTTTAQAQDASAAAQTMGMTARSGLDKAVEAIQSWQADATLTRVGTSVLQADGTATMWQYSFFSPETNACARVILLLVGEPRVQDLGECKREEAVSTDFVDSPVMLEAATAAGFRPDEQSDAYLALVHDAEASERECWVVHTIADFDAEHANMRGWCVDPRTGRFVVRLAGHG
jgi:hypothetical protein